MGRVAAVRGTAMGPPQSTLSRLSAFTVGTALHAPEADLPDEHG
jgi:hypothetical protein